MRILFAGGGTGGHLYPGLAIARAMRRLDPRVEPFFIGAMRGIERQVLPTTEFPHELLDLHPLYRSQPWLNWRTVRGAVSAWRSVSRISAASTPACIVGTGGYASGIALAHGVVHRRPIAIQEQNSFPGLTTRFFSRFARQVHNGFPEASRHLSPGSRTQIFDTGNPIEPPPAPLPDRRVARAEWGFPEEGGSVMLVYGGSQGAKAINETVARWLHSPDAIKEVFIIWATGERSYSEFASLESERVRVRPYLAPIAKAYAAADFALSRGGAMATAELCAWAIPPIVVPLPTAAADHQTANAKALAAAGAAELIPQTELTAERLDHAVRTLVINPTALAERSAAAASRARPKAAEDIARHILDMIGAGETVTR
ncbi:MAG TPA: UDP-N-acetylglucosamine--N-acetylmuramyl-(pentapeptide) pyrophosphoryl-undecaprenol N-acetylglucosamine transferase [Gemmatimonadaceae bacterium]|nr:UDP-N-acetylglucosamine--N-acetylmuramyl-(pentapeptide) pyrophosphoryl-undecaprenol N-acetylglucosamine transferase [Gemmatimonadaceae bacterium]